MAFALRNKGKRRSGPFPGGEAGVRDLKRKTQSLRHPAHAAALRVPRRRLDGFYSASAMERLRSKWAITQQARDFAERGLRI